MPAPRVIGTTLGRRIVAAASPAASVSAGARAAVKSLKGGQAPASPFSYPIHLFGEVDIGSGAEASVRSQALANRTGLPLEIHEIRFAVLAKAAASEGFTLMDHGGIIAASLESDGKPITHGYVPIWCLAKTEDYNAHVSIHTTGTLYGPWCQYVWRLSRPWYLQPGAEVSAQFRHSGASRFEVTAKIGLAGRTAARSATTSAVPYACSWASQPVKDTDTTIEESIETDLLNITKRTVMVDRIIARVSARFTTPIAAQDYLIFNDVAAWSGEFGGLDLKVFTSDHRPVMPEFLGVVETFGPRRALEVVHPFAPGDFYRASIQKTASFTSGANDYYAQAFVSAVGWREEAIR